MYSRNSAFKQIGFDSYNFSGGYRFYEAVTHERALIQQALDCDMDKL